MKNINSKDEIGDYGELHVVIKEKFKAKDCRTKIGKIPCLKEFDKEIDKEEQQNL